MQRPRYRLAFSSLLTLVAAGLAASGGAAAQGRRAGRVGRAAPLEVIYKLTDAKGGRYDKIVIPAGDASASLALDGTVSIVPNGDDYTAGAQRSAR